MLLKENDFKSNDKGISDAVTRLQRISDDIFHEYSSENTVEEGVHKGEFRGLVRFDCCICEFLV